MTGNLQTEGTYDKEHSIKSQVVTSMISYPEARKEYYSNDYKSIPEYKLWEHGLKILKA